MNNELLEIFDDTMKSLGLKNRNDVHKDGNLHQVVHCWGYQAAKDDVWLYFQQRAYTKKDYPGMYDLLATGHINEYENITDAVIRETLEESGITINTKRLKYMGRVRQTFFSEKINDNEMTNVFIYELEECNFNTNNEVERMIKIRFDEYKNFMTNKKDFVKAFTLDGVEFKIGKNEWCDKSAEYRAFIENLKII